MSSYQDLNMSENRKAERQKKKSRMVAAATSAVALLVVVGIAVVAVLQDGHLEDGKAPRSPNEDGNTIQSKKKSIEAICASTDYKTSCVNSLTEYTSKSNHTEPYDLVKAAVAVISDAITAAVNRSQLLASDDPKVKGAVEDCKVLFQDAKEELQSTVDIMDRNILEKIPQKVPELKNWLSAVISYGETCVDGFPDGELKTRMAEAVNSSKQYTSNALAIVTEVASILSILDIKGLTTRRRRRLLAPDGLPDWLDHGERRMLKSGSRLTRKLTPHVVVAKDCTGDFSSITDALNAMPKKYEGRYVIYVKEGVYNETPIVTKKMVNVTMYGDGARKTIVTGNKNFVDGIRTFLTASFVAQGAGFMAIGMGFRNTAGAIKHQAVAIRVQSDRAVFYHCRMEGYQDTLYAQTHRHFYKSCVIAGTIDFIFGDAAAVFQDCILVARRPLDNQRNIVTAQGRSDRQESTGFVIQNCRFVADNRLVPVKDRIFSYLGRPWKEYSRAVFMESQIDDLIHPDGYLPWDGDFGLKTLYYAEYNNRGPGAALDKRVKWPGVKVLGKKRARLFTAKAFIKGNEWIPKGVPARLGLFRP